MMPSFRNQLSALLVALVASASSQTVDEKCELHCTLNVTTSMADCHSHNPFGGCNYNVQWMSGAAPVYGNVSINSLSLYLGDFVTFDQSDGLESEMIVAVPTKAAFEECDLEESQSIINTNVLPRTIKYDALNFYYYAIGSGCEDGSKLEIGVFTVDSGLQCHDHSYEGAGDDTCHCHSYEEILCPADETSNYTLYTEHIDELEEYCQGVIDGTDTECPYKCYQPMEVLHLHYLECPSRVKDTTYMKAEATGLCHPAEENNGDRECPVVEIPQPVAMPVPMPVASPVATPVAAPVATSEESAAAMASLQVVFATFTASLMLFF